MAHAKRVGTVRGSHNNKKGNQWNALLSRYCQGHACCLSSPSVASAKRGSGLLFTASISKAASRVSCSRTVLSNARTVRPCRSSGVGPALMSFGSKLARKSERGRRQSPGGPRSNHSPTVRDLGPALVRSFPATHTSTQSTHPCEVPCSRYSTRFLSPECSRRSRS